jgi:hypothetical protein
VNVAAAFGVTFGYTLDEVYGGQQAAIRFQLANVWLTTEFMTGSVPFGSR